VGYKVHVGRKDLNWKKGMSLETWEVLTVMISPLDRTMHGWHDGATVVALEACKPRTLCEGLQQGPNTDYKTPPKSWTLRVVGSHGGKDRINIWEVVGDLETLKLETHSLRKVKGEIRPWMRTL
jgi:hypothetical protein